MAELLLETVLSLARVASGQASPAPTLLSQASASFQRLDEKDLEHYFNSNPQQGDTSATGAFVFLPVVKKPPLLPVLNLNYNLSNYQARLQVVLFVGGVAATHGARAFAYRYEPPEGSGGRHHFWHAQPTFELRLASGSMVSLPGLLDNWRPRDTPAFPLDAEEPTDLLLCLLISLYGRKDAGQMIGAHLSSRLSDRLQRMRSLP